MTPDNDMIQRQYDEIAAQHGTIPVPRVCYHGELSHQCWDCPRW